MSALLKPVALHDPSCPLHQPLHTTGQPPARKDTTAKCLGNRWCIVDLEAYVQASLNRSRRTYSVEEREELVAENMRICIDLASKFDPHREGYQQSGRLCGYISAFQPKKSEDAYHRLHPEHRLRADPATGKRTYVYGEKAVSLEALTGEDPDREPLLADVATLDAATIARRLHDAMFERWTARVKLWSEVGGLLAEGATDGQIADILGMTGDQVKQAKAAIAEAMPRAIGGEHA